MFKKIFTVIAIVAICFTFVAPVQAASKDMWAFVYSWDGKRNSDGTPVLTRLTSGVTFKVLQRNSDTAETLTVYNDNTATSLTNPVTTANFASDTVCNDMVSFRVDPGEANDTYVDLIVVDTAGGYTAFVEDFTETVHTIVIDERPNVQHHGVIWFSAAASETDTGIDFDYDTTLHDVVLEVVTAGASGSTLHVGLLSTESAGDVDGLLAGVAVNTAGYVKNLFSKKGALMKDSSDSGGSSLVSHTVRSANAKSLVYKSVSSGANTEVGYIHYYITRTR